MPLGAVGALLIACAAEATLAQQSPYGPPDRTAITRFMSRSSMQMSDLNNDCQVSDVDIAMAMLNRMTELYGPDLATVGDLDGDGLVTSEDVVTALGAIIKSTFGKTAANGSEVIGAADIQQTAINVSGGGAAGDLNFDGSTDAADLGVTIDRFGEEVDAWDIDHTARLLMEYIGALLEYGTGAFMASGCAPDGHLVAVSDTWPPYHPSWWPPNHLVSVSESYEGDPPEPPHDWYLSTQIPTGPHAAATSRLWPSNHLWLASKTWDPPGTHGFFSSEWDPPVHHDETVSASWPSGHMKEISSSWPSDHETLVSRTWWPDHTYSDSDQNIWPPQHQEVFSENWSHAVENSQANWPPNHMKTMSQVWGPSHDKGVSVSFPPGHLAAASNTWPGPQPSWPPGHTLAVSESWGDPEPGDWPDWPVFPPDHSYWQTFLDIRDLLPGQYPW